MTKHKLNIPKNLNKIVEQPHNIKVNKINYTKKSLDEIDDIIQEWRQKLYDHYNLLETSNSFYYAPKIKEMFTPESKKNICDNIQSIHPKNESKAAFISFFDEFIIKQTKTKLPKLNELIDDYTRYQTISNALIKSWNNQPLSDDEAESISIDDGLDRKWQYF